MKYAHPILGYPSKSAAAADMFDNQGLKQREIAERLGVKPGSVGNLVRVGRAAAGEPGGQYYTQSLSKTQRSRLRDEALKRRLTIRQLVNAVLVATIDDGLVAALLDNGDQPG